MKKAMRFWSSIWGLVTVNATAQAFLVAVWLVNGCDDTWLYLAAGLLVLSSCAFVPRNRPGDSPRKR